MDMPQQNANQPKVTPVIFQGKASEYFGVWIVNLLLSLITLGIYSAWAKVRRKKYFYNNTLIENVGFDYHAKPISILKGRIIALAFFALYGASQNIHPALTGLLIAIFLIALPWLVVRASIFNSRNTSHRGLRFDFVGKVREAVRVFIVMPLLAIVTVGLATPLASHQKNKFLVNNHKFGLSQFDMQASIKSFYMVYLKLLIIPVLIGILAAIAIPAYTSYVKKAAQANANITNTLPDVANFVAFNQQHTAQPNTVLAANEVATDTANIEANTESKKVERVYSENAQENPSQKVLPADVGQLADEQLSELQDAIPADGLQDDAQAEAASQQAQTEQQKAIEEMMKQQQNSQDKMRDWMRNPSVLIFMLAGLAGYILFIFGILGYMQARIGNLIWNSATLDDLSFKSTLRARDFAWLYFTNIVAVMLTFGLATPWAQIRMARYRASKLNIIGDVDFDQFVGDKKAEVKATGEEIADMFDLDISFG